MAGTDSTQTAVIVGPAPAVILVRPQMGENIGAAARAMKNFGLGEMRIVDPRDGWPNEKAIAMSSRADDILDSAALYDDTPAAVADLHAVYATTARSREMEKPCLTPREAVADMRSRLERGEQLGILFGGEKAGLSNDDATLAQSIIQIPANPAFSSLNLGQAVLLVAYEWFTSGPVPEAVVAGDSLPGRVGLFRKPIGRRTLPQRLPEAAGEAALDDAQPAQYLPPRRSDRPGSAQPARRDFRPDAS